MGLRHADNCNGAPALDVEFEPPIGAPTASNFYEKERAVIGQRIQNFEIVRLLGQGGMGAVYEAEHRVIRRKVAVKVLKPELATDSELVQRFFNEARATSAIQHPNIVEVIDLGVLDGGVPYLVMELLEGESLADRLARLKQLDAAQVVDFACQTAGALEAAHAHGIVHRDLKPDNLFLVRDERFADRELVKVLDFGIAKLRGGPLTSGVDTVAGAIWGTPPYMSPEQCRGVPTELDHRTDIYALAVIVYEALCGRTPFLGEGLGDVMMMHMGTEPEPISRHAPNVPPHIERAVHKALAKRPEHRFSSMAEFSAALRPSVPSVLASPKLVQLESRRPTPSAVVALASTSSPIGTFGTFPARPSIHSSTAADLAAHSPNVETANDLTRKQFKAALDNVQVLPAPHAIQVELPEASSQSSLQPAVMPSVTEPGSTDRLQQNRTARRRNVVVIAGMLAGLALLAIVPRVRRAPHPPIVGVQPRAPSQPASGSQNAFDTQPESRGSESSPTLVPPRGIAPPPMKPDLHAASHPRKARHANASRPFPTAVAPLESSNDGASTHPGKPTDAVIAVSEATSAATAVEPGYLSLDSDPWANVSLGTKQLGSTPLLHLALPPGKHILTLSNPELGISTSYTVEIKSGVPLSRLVGWRKP